MLIRTLNKLLNKFQLELKKNKSTHLPEDFNAHHCKIYNTVKAYTMTSPERVFSLIEAVDYIHKFGVEGSIVECGVWKGGSMMAVILRLMELHEKKRELFLYDTFDGMSEPTEFDIDPSGKTAASLLDERYKSEQDHIWAFSPLEAVKERIYGTNYPKNLINFIKGKVEETIPTTVPEKIAILRLDTDWYESTKHELIHLFPRLVQGGVLILDDYGHWSGAKRAVDEYLMDNKIKILLNRIDNTGRIAIKQ